MEKQELEKLSLNLASSISKIRYILDSLEEDKEKIDYYLSELQ